MLLGGAPPPAVFRALADCIEHIAETDDVVLLTPRWVDPESAISAERLIEGAVCSIEREGEGWILRLCIEGQFYHLPVREGEPDGDLVDMGDGVQGWTTMRSYGLTKLGPTVWKVSPSL